MWALEEALISSASPCCLFGGRMGSSEDKPVMRQRIAHLASKADEPLQPVHAATATSYAAARAEVKDGRGWRLSGFIYIPERLLLPLDLRALAAFRITLGLLVLVSVVELLHSQDPFLEDAGLCSRGRLLSRHGDHVHPLSIQLYFAAGHSLPLTVLLLAHAAAAAAFLAGYRTRLSSFMVWLFSMGLIGRLSYVGYGGDGLTTVLLFWSIWLPVGERYSVDALLEGSPPSNMGPRRSYVMLLELAVLYGCSGYYKTSKPWRDGTAAMLVMQGSLARTHALSSWLAAEPRLCEWLCHATIMLERHAWTVFFLPCWLPRLLVASSFLGMHLSLWILLRLHLFQPICCSALLACLPAQVWDAFDAVLAKITPVCASRPRDVKANGAARLGCNRQLKSWIGALMMGLTAFHSMKVSCIKLHNWHYQQKLSDADFPCYCYPMISAEKFFQRFRGEVPLLHRVLRVLELSAPLFGTDHALDMFAVPGQERWWVRMPGITRNGTQVAVWMDGEPNFDPNAGIADRARSSAGWSWQQHEDAFKRPPLIPFASHRWFKYFEHMTFNECRHDFNDFICREWNRRRGLEDNMTLAFFLLLQVSLPLPLSAAPENAPAVRVVYRAACLPEFQRLAEGVGKAEELSLQHLCNADRRLHGSVGALVPACRAPLVR